MGKCFKKIQIDINMEQSGGDDNEGCTSRSLPGTWDVL